MVEEVHENCGRLPADLAIQEMIDYEKVLVKMKRLWKSWEKSNGRHGIIQELRLRSLRSESEVYLQRYIHYMP